MSQRSHPAFFTATMETDEVPFDLPAEEPKPQFKGVWIPASIWENQTLNWTDKCLLAEIDCLSKGGCCFASNAFLAKKMRMTPGSLANSLSRLVKQKFILHLGYNGRKRQLLLAQNAQSDPQLRVHFKVKGTSSKSEGSLHPLMNIENSVEKKYRSSSALPAVRASGRSCCPSVEDAIEALEESGFRAVSHLEACAEKWFAAFGNTSLRDWRQHLGKFAEKYEEDYLGSR